MEYTGGGGLVPESILMSGMAKKGGSSMFCPKCGNPLLFKCFANGQVALYCVKGEMALSPAMQQRFEERYGPNPLPQTPHPLFNQRIHGGIHWFCPGDGEPLNPQLECPRCGKHLRDLLFPLVELHPHSKNKTGT